MAEEVERNEGIKYKVSRVDRLWFIRFNFSQFPLALSFIHFHSFNDTFEIGIGFFIVSSMGKRAGKPFESRWLPPPLETGNLRGATGARSAACEGMGYLIEGDLDDGRG
ncbi:hypothetical protein EVAR_29286_1 [Eumeta japonica]|uniref:Uncharacterized protein n=1 Tax=Eumeta variegata TaxID=151549 RepID=A0A4C1VUS9_EUMVA|nr:hypothetical protein EVAR_29286_1 [Eumeta japonica]